MTKSSVNRPDAPGKGLSKQTKWALIGVAALAALVVGVIVWGWGPSEEVKQIMTAVNNMPQLADHSGHVEKVDFKQRMDEHNKDNDRPFEAFVLDDDGKKIGILRGFRVEGFGTTVHRFKWAADGEALEFRPGEFRNRNRDHDHNQDQQHAEKR